MVYNNPHITGYYNSLNPPKQPEFFHCSKANVMMSSMSLCLKFEGVPPNSLETKLTHKCFEKKKNNDMNNNQQKNVVY